MPSVSVNLNVNVDASGNVSVFGQTPTAMSNVIVAAQPLGVANLSVNGVSDDSLFRFQDASGNVNTIYAELDPVWSANAAKKTALTDALHTIINGVFDCSGATPYSSVPYNTNPAYYSRSSFGQVALGAYAHDLFGHVAATAAIDNDSAFVTAMNAKSTGAQIPTLLANAIFSILPANATEIAKQVIGQDSSRTKFEDNDNALPVGWQALKFFSGDVVYVTINLLAPNVTLTNASQQNLPSTAVTRSYAVKMNIL